MKSAAFEYFAAKTLSDATSALGSGKEALAIAGGQSLLPMLNLRVATPDILVDIGALDELKETSETPATFRLGALATHTEIEDGKIPDPFGGLLRKVAAGISYRAIRNYGTVGGSVALADPAADWPVCLMALGADVRIASSKGVRSEPIDEFMKGQYTTSLTKDEIILGFDIARGDSRVRWGSFKVVRKSGAFASSIAIVVERDAGRKISVALGAAGPRPCLLRTVSQSLSSGAAEDGLRAAIANDMASHALDTDPYLTRLHTSTILRAVREMRNQ
jgi:aerobic carbon-monoxide dehydrogenase medium subunit